MKKRALIKMIVILTALAALALAAVPAGALSLPYYPSNAYASSVYYTRVRNVSLTGCPRIDIINVAHSQLGYHEGNSSSQLGGGNQSGEYNYTEYGYWYGTQVLHNSGGHYGDWCAMFVSWCAAVAGISSSVISRACYAHIGTNSYYFNMPFYYRGSYTPKPGDLVFFNWPDDDTQWDHVAIVYAVTGGCVYTLEGNTVANKVEKRGFPMTDSKILGYGVPNYPNNTVPGYVPGDLPPLWDANDPANYPVPTTTLSLGDSGQEVRWLQAALKRLGYPLTIDGQFGTATYNAVKAFQSAQGLAVTGTCNAATRTRIKNLLAALPQSTPTPTPVPTPTPTPVPSGDPTPTPYNPTGYPIPVRELYYGCSGDDVRWLQSGLNMVMDAGLDVDGQYGPRTYNAVADFQRAYGIEVTGVCDYATRDLLVSLLAGLEPTPAPSPMPTPTPTPSPSPTPTPTPTPSPTPSPTPADTPALSPTPTPTPTPSPTPGPTPADTPAPTAAPSQSSQPDPSGSPAPAVTPDPVEPLLGDVDGDGSVTALDALLLMRWSLGLMELEPEALAAADINGDGTVDALDALELLRMSLNG